MRLLSALLALTTFTLLSLATIGLPGTAHACGIETDCQIGERTYRIAMPPDGTAKGALIFAHGYRGTSKGTMRNQGLRRVAHEAGLAFVAADAGDDADWRIPNVPRNKNNDGSREFAYFAALIDDLVARHGLDRDMMIMSGFSAGGMVTWELACNRAPLFRAFVPIAGTFWAPVPRTCPTTPTDVVHIHGTADKIVPLKGRPIADTHQGDVFKALDLMHRQGGFGIHREFSAGELGCMRQTNDKGGLLVFCTHPGGHSIKSVWLKAALQIILAE